MAEAFSNKFTRAAGIVTTYSGSSVGIASTAITVTANTGIGVSDLVDNGNFYCWNQGSLNQWHYDLC